jgi:hypothetical protein
MRVALTVAPVVLGGTPSLRRPPYFRQSTSSRLRAARFALSPQIGRMAIATFMFATGIENSVPTINTTVELVWMKWRAAAYRKWHEASRSFRNEHRVSEVRTGFTMIARAASRLKTRQCMI